MACASSRDDSGNLIFKSKSSEFGSVVLVKQKIKLVWPRHKVCLSNEYIKISVSYAVSLQQ